MKRGDGLHIRLGEFMKEKEARSFWKEMGDMLKSEEDDLKTLARLGGLDPKIDFRGAHMEDANLANENLAGGFDLTGAQLAGRTYPVAI